jgi:hypothetical protein
MKRDLLSPPNDEVSDTSLTAWVLFLKYAVQIEELTQIGTAV